MASACQRSVHQRSVVRPDGQLAPLAFPQTTRTTVHVDSRHRDFSKFPSASEFVFALPEELHAVSAATVVAARVPLPIAFAAARGNTSFTLTHNGVTHTVTVPDGTYTIAELNGALATALYDAFGTGFDVFAPSDPVAKAKIVASEGGTLAVHTTTAKPTDWGLAYHMGFLANVPATGTDEVVAPGRYIMTEPYVMAHVEELDGQVQGATHATAVSGRRALAKVPLVGDAYLLQPQQAWTSVVEPRPPVSRLKSLRVSLRYHDGALVDLGNREWSFTLGLAHSRARAP